MAALEHVPVLVVAQPLRCQDWLYMKGSFARRGVPAWCVTLAAEPGRILDPGRGRRFSEGERARIVQMVAQGYAARRFSNAVVATDLAGFDATAARLEASCRRLLAG
jgi:hypothetical protein